jgi:hypothetical protein
MSWGHARGPAQGARMARWPPAPLPTIEAEFRRHPPSIMAEPTARIEALTGLTHNPTQVRQALNALRMRPRRVGSHIRPPAARLRAAPG